MAAPRRLVAICAPPPQFNPGMHAVDSALGAVVRRHGLDVEIDRRMLYTPAELHAARMGGSADAYGLPFTYGSLRDPGLDLAGAAAILFWGDFLHSRHYRSAVARVLVHAQLAGDDAAAHALVDRHLFLADEPASVLGRTLLFGGCLLTDGPNAESGDVYDRALTRLLRGARDVWMRDLVSARRAAEIRRSPASHLGVDGALLLRPEDCEAIAQVARRPSPAGPLRAGVFFARTPDDPRRLLRFARALADRVRAHASWLPWFTAGAVDADVIAGERAWLAAAATVETLSGALAALLACDVVITDTYHLGVIAWNNRIPAVLVSRGATAYRSALSDKKKEMFALTYAAQRFHVFAEHVPQVLGEAGPDVASNRYAPMDLAPPSLEALARDLRHGALTGSITRRMHVHRDAAESSLVDTIRALTTTGRRAWWSTWLPGAGREPVAARDAPAPRVTSGSTREMVAVIAAFNEADVIAYAIKKLVDQGIGVYLIDNWSSDATLDQALLFQGRGLVGYERFPGDGPSSTFATMKLLARTEALHLELGARWMIHHDVDEIRESPWPGVSYADGLQRVEAEGYTCINHVVVMFRPTDDRFAPGGDMERHFHRVEGPHRPGHFVQMKAWHTREPIELQPSLGHNVRFADKRVYPIPFVLKHYPIRGQAQGDRKIHVERKPRFDPAERALQYHTHYDDVTPGTRFVWPADALLEWNESTKAAVIALCQERMGESPHRHG